MRTVLACLIFGLFFLFSCTEVGSIINEGSQEVVGSEDPLHQKFEKGINFFAQGDEPYWYLEMDFDNRFRFKELNSEIFTVDAVRGGKTQDTTITRYRSVSDQGEMIVTINEPGTACKKRFSHSVFIEIKAKGEKEYRPFSGCGDYVPDFRINDFWILEKLNGVTVTSEEFNDKLPKLHFKLNENKFNGYAGCNWMKGGFWIEHDRIYFERGPMTKMACPGDGEQRLLKALDETSHFHIDGNRLYLKKGEKTVAIYKKDK